MNKLMMCMAIALVGVAATGSAFAAGDGKPAIGVAEFKNDTAACVVGRRRRLGLVEHALERIVLVR